MTLKQKIQELKEEKNAIILAHYYQRPEIQEIADYIGDSLELSRIAQQTDKDVIVFAGVYFMAETAKILNPSKTVLIPDMEAGCSLADSCRPSEFEQFVDAHPGHAVVSYINSSIEIKAMSDVICTSSNADKVVQSIPDHTPVIFGPDKHLGAFVEEKTKRPLVKWDGACLVHEAFSLQKLLDLYKKHPGAVMIAHPESDANILRLAAFIGSTKKMLLYVKESNEKVFIIATEEGILHQMRKQNPDKLLIAAPIAEDNECACSECSYMKLNTLEKVYDCLAHNSNEVHLDETLRLKAERPILKMLELS